MRLLKRMAVLVIRSALSLVFRLLPLRLRINLLSEAARAALSGFNPREKLEVLLELDNRLYALQGKAATEYGDGVHTKHKHINYHAFFIRHLHPGERVLDIGSGIGFMDYDLVTRVPGLKVAGIEILEENIAYARGHYSHPNLEFIHGDALKDLPAEKFDVVTMSNVLEHIDRRVDLLRKIIETAKPGRFLIRVPLFERDWRVPLKMEIGLDYRLDVTHCIEFTQETFREEMEKSGLRIAHLEVRWGEIWSVLEVA